METPDEGEIYIGDMLVNELPLKDRMLLWFSRAMRCYQMMGWDPQTGEPTLAELEELGIGWISRSIESIDRISISARQT